MEKDYFQKVVILVSLVILLGLAFFLLKPILLSVIGGFILAFIFTPFYNKVRKVIKNENAAAVFVSFVLILLFLLPFIFLIPVVWSQSGVIYQELRSVDLVVLLQDAFPISEDVAREIILDLHSILLNALDAIKKMLSSFIFDIPLLFLKSVVVLLTFFFVLRDGKLLIEYAKSLIPFSKDVEKKLFDSSKIITEMVIYGQVIVGFLQGFIVGIGFFIFGVPNALFLTLIACLAGIFPVIGTVIVWLPVVMFLYLMGDTSAAIGLIVFGLISSSVDNFLRPLIVSRKAKMNVALVFIGMIGGLLQFGIIGFVIGPLILAYLFILLESYRGFNFKGILNIEG